MTFRHYTRAVLAIHDILHYLEPWVTGKLLNELKLPLTTAILGLEHTDNTADARGSGKHFVRQLT